MPLQIRRGTPAERTGLTTPLAIGELLYTTDGKLYIGDGTNFGAADISGNPSQGGKGLIITGFSTEEAQDAAALLFSNGTHSNIVFAYNDNANALSAQVDLTTYTGNINVVNGIVDADFRGSVFADNSTLLVDAVDGSIPYAVLSGAPSLVSQFTNDVGYIRVADIADGTVTIDVNNTGDLQGSVFGDDSTMLVDATNSTIPASVVTGTFTGNVLGNLTGNIVQVDSLVPGVIALSVDTAHDTASLPSILGFRRSRNTTANPTAVQSNDTMMSQIAYGYDGTDYSASTVIQSVVDGAVTSGNVPGKLVFATVNTSGLITTHVTIDRLGKLSALSGGIDIFNYGDSAAGATSFAGRRSRGTVAAPTVPVQNDQILNFTANTWDGTSYIPSTVIGSTIDGNVSAGIAPAAIFFATSNSAGVLATRVSIESSGRLFAGFGIQADTILSTAAPIISSQAHNSPTQTSIINLRRSRGTGLSPTAVETGDILHNITYAGFDGVDFVSSVNLRSRAYGPVTAGLVAGEFLIRTRGTDGAFLDRVSVTGDSTTFFGPVRTPSIEITENNIVGLNSNEDITFSPSGTGTLDLVISEQSTVGPAGPATALPATPSTYFRIKVNGVDYVVPAYAVA